MRRCLARPTLAAAPPILLAGAGAHFRDHQQITGARHDIELTDATQEIARDDGESLRFEEGAGAVLGQ